MAEHPVLSAEELDYIRRLFDQQLIDQVLNAPTFRIDGGPQANALLSSLGSHASLSLEASLDHCRLVFPLHLTEDELHGLHLEIGPPNIYEEGSNLRPWRLELEKPISLRSQNGRSSPLRIIELAPNSLLLERNDGASIPERFDLWLRLPNKESFPVHGKLIRRIDKASGAYQLGVDHQEHGERIRHFIFEQYRQRHPQLQIAG